MAATAARDSKRKAPDLVSYQMGVIKIYKGTMVSVRTDGYVYPARSGTSTDNFVGVAHETVDNTAGAAGDKRIRLEKEGTFVFLKATAAITDISVAMYASDDQTLTATSTNNQLVGYACDLDDPAGVVSTTTLRVRLASVR